MSLFARLTEKPWLTPGLDAGAAAEAELRQSRTVATGLTVFLCVVAMFFALITAAYLMRMGYHASLGHGGGDWRTIPEPGLLWFNTAVLIVASLAWQLARAAARQGKIAELRIGLIAGGVLTLGFLAGQIVVWRELNSTGYFLSFSPTVCDAAGNPLAPPTGPFITGNPAAAFFYLITGIHGLHMIGGLAVWARATFRFVRRRNLAAVAASVDLCARYWHFLLLVWLLMFALLLMT